MRILHIHSVRSRPARLMCKILMDSKITLTTSAEKETAKKMKEELCYVAEDYDADMADFQDKTKKFEMPDGTTVEVHAQQIRCPELMFKPALDGREMPGLHQLTDKTIKDCDLDVRKDLLGNVVMSGGTTMFPNMPERPRTRSRPLWPRPPRSRSSLPPSA